MKSIILRLNPGGGTSLYRLYKDVQPKRVCFLAVLVINRISTLVILVSNRVCSGTCLEFVFSFFRRSYLQGIA